MDYSVSTILFASDLSGHAPEVARHAVGLARQFGAKVHVLHVLEPIGDYANSLITNYLPSDVLETVRQESYAAARKDMQQRLEKLCDDLDFDAAILADVKLLEGIPHRVILDEASRINASLIVMGAHGHSALGELLLGSVAHKVVMKSPVPVLLVPIKPD